MLELYNLGLTELDLKEIINTNPEIKELTDFEIYNQIKYLKEINCNKNTIKNIIITNPFYLTRDENDFLELINKLTILGLTNLNLLFDENPFLLNKDAFEIDEFISSNQEQYSKEEIIEMIESNPYIIDES